MTVVRRAAAWSLFVLSSVVAQQTDTTAVPDSLKPSRYSLMNVRDFLRPDSTDSLRLYKIVSHDELMLYYHEDFADLLWNVAGMYVHDLGSYGKPITASFNGLGNRSVLFLLDGVPMEDPDVGRTNLNAISLENIERVEIFRGSAVSRYGPHAAGGFVNIVSREVPRDHAITRMKYRSVFSTFQDIGAYFGRPIGNHLLVRFGGSAKETPGEQNAQGYQGGIIRSIQRTRYNGSILFGGVTFLAGENLLMDVYRQSAHDRYDAYGRNLFGDSKNLDFTTPNGRRTDDRDDYRLSVIHRIAAMEQKLTATATVMERAASSSFGDTVLAPSWGTTYQRIAYELRFPFRSVVVQGGAGWNRWHSKKTIGNVISEDGFLRGEIRTRPLLLSGGMRLEHHEKFGSGVSTDANAVIPYRDARFRTSVGYSVQMPEMLDGWLASKPNPFAVSSSLSNPRVLSIGAGVDWQGYGLDRLSLDGTIHHVQDGIYADPIHYYSDSTTFQLRNAPSGRTVSADLELTKRTGAFVWTARQSLMKGTLFLHQGTPTYMTLLTGRGDRSFLTNHLRLTGILQARFVSRHDGFTYADLPPVYMVAPRRSAGGWIINTRVTATIGSFRFFYEAENILRARFTMLDGYDVTRQQVRVGLIWGLID